MQSVIYFLLYLCRIPQVNRSGKGDESDLIKPVYVGEFPEVVRDQQASLFQKRVSGEYVWFYWLLESSV